MALLAGLAERFARSKCAWARGRDEIGELIGRRRRKTSDISFDLGRLAAHFRLDMYSSATSK